MLIRCEGHNDHDRYYLKEFSELDELKVYAENNIPIKCYLLGGRYCNSIFIIEESREVYLYLNNYLYYYQIEGYLLLQEEYNDIYYNQCKECTHNDGWSDCIYKEEKDIKNNCLNNCLNYKKKFSLFNWIRGK